MYLENIFIGSEDIRKQLPQESVMFDQVHATFMKQMQQLNTAHNAVQVSPVSTNAGTNCLLSVSKGLRAGLHCISVLNILCTNT